MLLHIFIFGAAMLLGTSCSFSRQASPAPSASGGQNEDYESAMTSAESQMGHAGQEAVARQREKTIAIEGALAYRRTGQYEHALALLLRAKRHLPADAELLLDLALLEDEMHLYVDADTAVSTAHSLSPADPKILYATARIKMDLQQIPEAEQAISAYLAVHPEDASAHYGLGRMYRIELRNDEASKEFALSLAIQPKQAESNYQLAEIALEQADSSGADKLYAEALSIDPSHAGALTGKAMLAYRRKDYASAYTLLSSAEKSAPTFAKAHYYRGLVLLQMGRKSESDAELALASKLGADQNGKGLRLADQP